ncbi:MAG: hypothetical protein JSS66_12715 [Armatimonadetes bacterium]|nr:hypothetical protein [Armatimonadota bacterium]
METPQLPKIQIPKTIVRNVVLVLAAIWLFGTLRGCWQQIPPASVGIRFNARSGISEKLVRPQLTFVGPMERLIIYPTSMKNASYVRAAKQGEREGDDAIRASTIEGATLPVDVTVAWHVDPAEATVAFRNFGTEDMNYIQENFIRFIATYGVNAVSGIRSIFDLTAKERQQFGPEVKKFIQPLLNEYGIVVDEVYIGEVYPADEILAKVQERVSKRNELELAKVNLEKARIDAKTMLTNAERDAEVNRLKALQGDKAIALRRLELKRKALDKWNGKPSLIGDGTVPFTDISVR